MHSFKSLWTLFFYCFLSLGATTDGFTETMHGNYTFSTFEPLYCTGESQHYQLNYLFASGSTHAFEVLFESAVTDSLYAQNVLAAKTVTLVALNKYRGYHYGNYHLAIEFDVPTRYVDKASANTLFFTDHLYEIVNGSSKETAHHETKVNLYAYTPKVWGKELYESAPLTRAYPSLIKINDGFYPQLAPFSVEHVGFARGYVNPLNNCFPLRNWKIRCRDCEKKYVAPPFLEASLDITGAIEDYQIGQEITVSGGPHLHFPLAFKEEANSFFHLRLKDSYYVSPDLRTMRNAANHLAGDLLTHDLFLPPVSAGSVNSYELTLSILGFGDVGKDSIITKTYISKDSNSFGSCATSAWCVVEK
jgi:hypothetical protein